MIETDWLQKAQQASKIRAQVGDKGKSALETALEARLAAAVARTAEADASAAMARRRPPWRRRPRRSRRTARARGR